MENIVHVRKESFVLKEEAGIEGRWSSFLNTLRLKAIQDPKGNSRGRWCCRYQSSDKTHTDNSPAMCGVFAQSPFYFSKNIHQKPLQKQGEEWFMKKVTQYFDFSGL